MLMALPLLPEIKLPRPMPPIWFEAPPRMRMPEPFGRAFMPVLSVPIMLPIIMLPPPAAGVIAGHFDADVEITGDQVADDHVAIGPGEQGDSIVVAEAVGAGDVGADVVALDEVAVAIAGEVDGVLGGAHDEVARAGGRTADDVVGAIGVEQDAIADGAGERVGAGAIDADPIASKRLFAVPMLGETETTMPLEPDQRRLRVAAVMPPIWLPEELLIVMAGPVRVRLLVP